MDAANSFNDIASKERPSLESALKQAYKTRKSDTNGRKYVYFTGEKFIALTKAEAKQEGVQKAVRIPFSLIREFYTSGEYEPEKPTKETLKAARNISVLTKTDTKSGRHAYKIKNMFFGNKTIEKVEKKLETLAHQRAIEKIFSDHVKGGKPITNKHVQKEFDEMVQNLKSQAVALLRKSPDGFGPTVLEYCGMHFMLVPGNGDAYVTLVNSKKSNVIKDEAYMTDGGSKEVIAGVSLQTGSPVVILRPYREVLRNNIIEEYKLAQRYEERNVGTSIIHSHSMYENIKDNSKWSAVVVQDKGRTLKDELNDKSAKEKILHIREAAVLLQNIHRVGITHGDVKIDNIYKAPNEKLVLGDIETSYMADLETMAEDKKFKKNKYDDIKGFLTIIYDAFGINLDAIVKVPEKEMVDVKYEKGKRGAVLDFSKQEINEDELSKCPAELRGLVRNMIEQRGDIDINTIVSQLDTIVQQLSNTSKT